MPNEQAAKNDPPRTEPVAIPRQYPPVPLVGVAAAVFNPEGKVLLVERANPPSQGLWGLPGGLLELGEKLAEGARREIREECAVEVAIGEVVATFEPIRRDEAGRIRYHYVVIDFWADYVGGELRAADDAAAADWFDVDALDSLAMDPETRSVVRKAFVAWQEHGGSECSGHQKNAQAD